MAPWTHTHLDSSAAVGQLAGRYIKRVLPRALFERLLHGEVTACTFVSGFVRELLVSFIFLGFMLLVYLVRDTAWHI